MGPDPHRQEIEARLKSLSSRQEERLVRRWADNLRLPYVNLVAFPLDPNVLELVPKDKARRAQAVLFYKKGRDLRLGAVNPESEETRQLAAELERDMGASVQLHVISPHSLEAALSRYRREREVKREEREGIDVSRGQLKTFASDIKNLSELGQRISSVTPTELLTTITAGALAMRASDIHLEPLRETAKLRYRIDGVLQDIAEFGREGWKSILSRVKFMSGLKLNVSDVPQSGSFVLRVNGARYSARVSVMPGAFGENIVMRLFSRQQEATMTLAELGMKERDLQVIREGLKESTGMLLAAGPTGSGKTTTIVACIKEVNRPELKVISLEDPVEYQIKGVEQTEVDSDAGYTMAVALRSVLRQDPDVIFVGEIRDEETAEASVHASMTGHLVFSTIHANDAAGVVLRAVDIGIQPYVLAPALNVVIGQRLVRKACEECGELYKPDQPMRRHIKKVMASAEREVFDPAVLDDPELKFIRAKGCDACDNTGYRGRTGVFEVFAVKGEMEELILEKAYSSKIKAAAIKSGMTTIAQDAYLKVIGRITTVEEVKRISEE